MWGSGNKVTYELEGHRFLPRAGVFFWACINTFWLEFENNLKLWLWTSQVMNVQKNTKLPVAEKGFHPQGAILHCPVHERKILLQEGFFMISFSWTDGPKKNRNIAGFELMQISYWKNTLPLNHQDTLPVLFNTIELWSIFLHKGCGKIGLQLAFSLTLSHTHTHTQQTLFIHFGYWGRMRSNWGHCWGIHKLLGGFLLCSL